MANAKLDNRAENALSDLQDTLLSPMEEALFQSWAKANQITKPDNPEDHVDYRGVYKEVGGQVLPRGAMPRIAKTVNSEKTLMRVLQERMMDSEGNAVERQNKLEDEDRKDARTEKQHHQKIEQGKQKIEQEHMALRKAPHETKAAELANQGKEIDLEAKKVAGKQQLVNLIVERTMGPSNGSPKTTKSTGSASSK